MTTAAPTRTARPVSVDELARAWHAIQDGQFRRRPDRQQPPRPAPPGRTTGHRWTPTGTVLPVLGCVGQAGASTLAMAIATAAAPARVIECCSATATGLAAAATAELGTSERGWSLGRREQVWIARTTRAHLGAARTATRPGRIPRDLVAHDHRARRRRGAGCGHRVRMTRVAWTTAERALAESDLTDEDIAEQTGRALSAVARYRRRTLGRGPRTRGVGKKRVTSGNRQPPARLSF